MQSFTIGKNEAGQRFDKFLIKYFPEASKSFLYKMLRKKNITLNGKKAEGNEFLAAGDTVESFFSAETYNKFRRITGEIYLSTNNINDTELCPKIIYEDDNIILADKPTGMLTQKASPKDYSVNDWLIDYLISSNQITETQLMTFHPAVCNRLDRNTSGIVVCGKSLLGLQIMTELIRTKKLEKHYMTLCHGHFDKPGKIEAIITKNEKNNTSTVKNSLSASEKPNIITEFSVINYYSDFTLLDVNLLTGKSHQIRAQLSSLGFPIYGDVKYKSKEINKDINKNQNKNKNKDININHQLLTAYKLIFPKKADLPSEMQHLADKAFEIKLPDEFDALLKKLK